MLPLAVVLTGTVLPGAAGLNMETFVGGYIIEP